MSSCLVFCPSPFENPAKRKAKENHAFYRYWKANHTSLRFIHPYLIFYFVFINSSIFNQNRQTGCVLTEETNSIEIIEHI
jgi:hypothetical protein